MTADRSARNPATVRGVGVARAVVGGLMLARPAVAARWVAGTRRPRIPTAIARVLATRLVVQAAAELAHPSRSVARASAAVDATHALSMAVPAGLDRRYLRAAVINAVAATVTAALLAREARPIR